MVYAQNTIQSGQVLYRPELNEPAVLQQQLAWIL